MFKSKLPYIITGTAFFLYVLIRAFNVGITYDEVTTLMFVIPHSFTQIITFDNIDANNHLLNSVLIKFLFSLGSNSLFIARLPNVLAFVLFLGYSYKICYEFIKNTLGVCVFVLLIANPFMLDFFGLARGYGISLGLEIASLYYMVSYFYHKNIISAVISIILAAFAVLSNFTLLNYFLVIVFIINGFTLVFNTTHKKFRLLIYSLISVIVLSFILYGPITKLKAINNFYYGGDSDFYSDTLLSLCKYSLYSMETTKTAKIVLPLFLVIVFVFTGYSFLKNKLQISSKTILVSVLILCALSTIVQHYLLGTLYLIDRMALLFYPLLILTLAFSAQELESNKFSAPILFVICIAFLGNFLIHANFYKTVTWFFDARTEAILENLNEKGKQERKLIKLFYSWPFESSIAYYYSSSKYPFIEQPQEKKTDFDADTDYFLFCGKSLDNIKYKVEEELYITNVQKDTILQFKEDDIYVFTNIH